MKFKRQMLNLTIIAVFAGVISCSGSSGDGESTNNGNSSGFDGSLITRGIISGFGSVIVNDVQFNTDNASFATDDKPCVRPGDASCTASQADLDIGMVVEVISGDVGSNLSGSASLVSYNDDLQGPVSGKVDNGDGTGEFTVLGTRVIVDNNTLFDDTPPVSLATMTDGDVVEVSGLYDNNGTITATHIERKTTENGDYVVNSDSSISNIELKGTIAGLDESANTFLVRNLTVDYSSAVLDDNLTRGLENDLFVEIKGTLSADGSTLLAGQIEREDFGSSSSTDVEVHGIVTGFTGRDSNFFVGVLEVNASRVSSDQISPANLFESLANLARVDVEGSIDSSGIMQVREIKIRSGDIRIESRVAAVDGNELRFDIVGMENIVQLAVVLDSNTRGGSGVQAGDFVEVRARRGSTGDSPLLVTRLEVEDESDDVKVRGPIDAIDPGAQTITVLV